MWPPTEHCFFKSFWTNGRKKSPGSPKDPKKVKNLGSSKVLRIFFKILVIWANFGDFGILVSTSKFWKNLVRIVTPYWDQFWKILTIEFWWNRKVMINHRGGILIFGQILSKSKILDFRVKDLKFCDFAKFWILGLRTSNFVISSEFSSNLFNFDQKLKFCGLGLRISNFDFR